jgi:histone demethylase JARID1
VVHGNGGGSWLGVNGDGDAPDAAHKSVADEVQLATHYARKLFCSPICFDAVNAATNARVAFEPWLLLRMRAGRAALLASASAPSGAGAGAGVGANGKGQSGKAASLRARRPRLILAEAREKEFACLCREPPRDALITVRCFRCGQGYHASCVGASLESCGVWEGARDGKGKKEGKEGKEKDGKDGKDGNGNGKDEKKPWRCPCCIVKEGKLCPSKDVEVRVQVAGECARGSRLRSQSLRHRIPLG